MHLSLPFYSKEPIESSLADIRPIEIVCVSGSEGELLWNHLMAEYHYLGYTNGTCLKYLAYHGSRIIGGLGWGNAAWHLEARDSFIGWAEPQRFQYVHHIVNNTRFLILPWVRVPHLASHLLGRQVRMVPKDWQARFGRKLYLLETFVDAAYRGTSYRAANWIAVGKTKGFARVRPYYRHHGRPKEILLYVLDLNFRKHFECEDCPRRSPSPKEVQRRREWSMLIQDAEWDAAILPITELEEDEIESLAEDLVEFHEYFADCFKRVESRGLGVCLLRGLLSKLERKSVEPIALELLGTKRVRALQMFLSQQNWDLEGLLEKLAERAKTLVEDPTMGMLTVDSSEFVKKGRHSAGVCRQYCGTLGKTENCQSGVFVGYASDRGYLLLDGQLYIPEKWFGEDYAELRKKAHIPEDLKFKKKGEIAIELIAKAAERLKARWVGADSFFGKSEEFLQSLPDGLHFFADIPANTVVRLCNEGYRKGRLRMEKEPVRVDELVESERLTLRHEFLGEGTKGPVYCEWAAARAEIYRAGKVCRTCWVIVRRLEDGSLKYALSNAPEDCPPEDLKKASLMRWSIEQCFREGKSYLGMADYEIRGYQGWRRHMAYVMLAMLFLLEVRQKLKKKRPT